MIRHARPAPALTVLLLAVAMIEPPLGTLLVAAIGRTMLTQAGLPAASPAAIALPTVTMRAQEKHRAAFAGMTKPLPQNCFRMRRHASS